MDYVCNLFNAYHLCAEYNMNDHEPIPIPVNRHRTYVDPTTYASVDEAIEEFAKEIEPKSLRLDSEIGAGTNNYRICLLSRWNIIPSTN